MALMGTVPTVKRFPKSRQSKGLCQIAVLVAGFISQLYFGFTLALLAYLHTQAFSMGWQQWPKTLTQNNLALLFDISKQHFYLHIVWKRIVCICFSMSKYVNLSQPFLSDSFCRLHHYTSRGQHVLISELSNHSFYNKTSYCIYVWVIINSTDSLKIWFIQEWNMLLTLSESVNHWLNRFVQNPNVFINETSDCLLCESLSYSFSPFFKNSDTSKNETGDCPHERVIESLIQTIHSKNANSFRK